jgi:hypothetical protein
LHDTKDELTHSISPECLGYFIDERLSLHRFSQGNIKDIDPIYTVLSNQDDSWSEATKLITIAVINTNKDYMKWDSKKDQVRRFFSNRLLTIEYIKVANQKLPSKKTISEKLNYLVGYFEDELLRLRCNDILAYVFGGRGVQLSTIGFYL